MNPKLPLNASVYTLTARNSVLDFTRLARKSKPVPGNKVYRNESNYIRTIPPPPFPRKWLIIAFTHIWNYYSNIWTPTLCGTQTEVAKHVLAFDSLCGAQTEVAKHVLAFDSLCGAQTEVAKCVLPFDILCRAWTGVRERLRQSLRGWTGLLNVFQHPPLSGKNRIPKRLLILRR